MKPIFILLLAVTVTGATAQTKKIAYKSHSGAAANFPAALADELFDMGHSNFGVAPTTQVKFAELDSVIFICDTLALMVTSEYCARRSRLSQSEESGTTLWRPGKIEVKNHPLFSRQHSLDSIRKVIRTMYHFRNPVEKTVFVGYDNNGDRPITKKRKSDPVRGVLGFTTQRPPLDNTGTAILTGILLVALCSGGIAWFFYKGKNRALIIPVAVQA